VADEPQDRPPPPPSGPVQHPHVTLPFGVPVQSQVYPGLSYPSQPHVDLKPKANWHDVIKTAIVVLGALGTVAGYLYSAGIQAGETRSFKETVNARLDQQDARESVRAEDLRSTKTAVIDLVNQVREVNSKLQRRLNITRRNHRQHDATEDE
jgi:hypothetical protein